jgi:hypothetical protein
MSVPGRCGDGLPKMQEVFEMLRVPEGPMSLKHLGLMLAAGVVAFALVGILLPFVLILLGYLLLISVGVHAAAPQLRQYADPLLRVPVAGRRRRFAHVATIGAIGVLFVSIGAVSMSVRGRVFGEREQISQERAANAELVDGLLARARAKLATGELGEAELLLWNAVEAGDAGVDKRDEAEDLLQRLRKCSDSAAILEILVALPPDQLAALDSSTAVPSALDFGEKELTEQAMRVALEQLDEAKRRRAAR